jgi:hypothetical protein
MSRRHACRPAILLVFCATVASTATAQAHDHMQHESTTAAMPTLPGQAAFGAIAEIVHILEADPATDWTRVNIEALRQHLIDMDEVTMRAAIVKKNIPNGIEASISGTGRTLGAIQRMAVNQSGMLNLSDDYAATATVTPTGARVVITSRHPDDPRAVARLRGLGYAGLLTEGDHHVRHHLAIARGDADAHKH